MIVVDCTAAFLQHKSMNRKCVTARSAKDLRSSKMGNPYFDALGSFFISYSQELHAIYSCFVLHYTYNSPDNLFFFFHKYNCYEIFIMSKKKNLLRRYQKN